MMIYVLQLVSVKKVYKKIIKVNDMFWSLSLG